MSRWFAVTAPQPPSVVLTEPPPVPLVPPPMPLEPPPTPLEPPPTPLEPPPVPPWQAPALHDCPAPHDSHSWPPWPQLPALRPATHSPFPLQQPLQFAAVQLGRAVPQLS